MFPGDRIIALEGGLLRSVSRFQSGKRRRTVKRRGSCSMTRGEDYEFVSHLEEGFCIEEEEYQLISKGEDESK